MFATRTESIVGTPGPTQTVDVRLLPQDDTDGIDINTRA